jgi:hypothetical protein
METMRSSRVFSWTVIFAAAVVFSTNLSAQNSSSASSPAPNSTSRKPTKSSPVSAGVDPGTVTNGLYRNKTFGFACRIPEGWVLRTDELNAQEDNPANADPGHAADAAKDSPPPASSAGARVLLAAFSRPPAAAGEDVNSSILIVAENAVSYPGLKEAVQYFEPLTEVAAARGFSIDEDPYEVAIGTKTLVRADFHKDVASRVMRQSTLAMLSHGYAVSITVIAGTEDDVEDLIDGLDFAASPAAKK